MRSSRHSISNAIAAAIVIVVIAVAGGAILYTTSQTPSVVTSTVTSTSAFTTTSAVTQTSTLTSSVTSVSVATSFSTSVTTVTTNASAFPVSPPDLVARAKAEGGSITIYSIEDPTTFQLHTWPPFQQLFPWAKVNFVPLDPGSLISRPIAEYKSGHVTSDVNWWGAITCVPLDQAGVVQHENLTALQKQEGYPSSQISQIMTPVDYYPNVVFYNTNLVNSSNPKLLPVPASYSDLAKPVYNGKLALANPVVNDDPGDTYVGMYYELHNNATWTSTMKAIAANAHAEPFGGAAYTDVSQGQYAIGIDTLNDVVNGILAGLPVAVDWKIPIVYAGVGTECVMKGAPHPNMALLFSEWQMSAAFAPVAVGAGFLPPQPDALKSVIASGSLVPSNTTINVQADLDYSANYSFWARALTPIFGSGG